LVMKMFLSCALLVALSCHADALLLIANATATRFLRQGNASDNALRAPIQPISKVVLRSRKPRDERVMDAINQFRAQMCADMKDEYGKKFDTYADCKKFMEGACKPGKDEAMDGDRKEMTTKQGFCTEYFPKAKKRAEEKVDREDKEEASKANATSSIPAPSPSLAPAPASAGGPAPAPAPGPMAAPAAPAPAPAPGPFLPGIHSGKPWGEIPDDEKYYYKKGGKDISRIHMSEQMKLPEQGYWGKLVEHDDQKSMTSDWGKEFGPHSGHASLESVCRQHPDSRWCIEHRAHQSTCRTVSLDIVQWACLAVLAVHNL